MASKLTGDAVRREAARPMSYFKKANNARRQRKKKRKDREER